MNSKQRPRLEHAQTWYGRCFSTPMTHCASASYTVFQSQRLLALLCALGISGCGSDGLELVPGSAPSAGGGALVDASAGAQGASISEKLAAESTGGASANPQPGLGGATEPFNQVGASPDGGAGGSSAQDERELTVLLVLDRSGSMAGSWDGGSKWQVALNAFFAGMVGVEEKLIVGALVFPNSEECTVDRINASSQFAFQRGDEFVANWASRESEMFPSGGTPLGQAFENADLAVAQAQAAGMLERRRFRVLVVTDGEPNCGTDNNRLIYLAERWRELGVEVHVMGLPGSAPAAALLDAIAQTGGTTDYVAPTTGDEAEDTFYHSVR